MFRYTALILFTKPSPPSTLPTTMSIPLFYIRWFRPLTFKILPLPFLPLTFFPSCLLFSLVMPSRFNSSFVASFRDELIRGVHPVPFAPSTGSLRGPELTFFSKENKLPSIFLVFHFPYFIPNGESR
jgi:hypothetical protein